MSIEVGLRHRGAKCCCIRDWRGGISSFRSANWKILYLRIWLLPGIASTTNEILVEVLPDTEHGISSKCFTSGWMNSLTEWQRWSSFWWRPATFEARPLWKLDARLYCWLLCTFSVSVATCGPESSWRSAPVPPRGPSAPTLPPLSFWLFPLTRQQLVLPKSPSEMARPISWLLSPIPILKLCQAVSFSMTFLLFSERYGRQLADRLSLCMQLIRLLTISILSHII